MNIDAFHYLEAVRKIAFALPGVTEGICYGTPGFYVGKKLFARIREEGDILVIYTEERDAWMKKDSKAFFITDHYLNSSYMLVAMPCVKPADLKQLLQTAWRNRATKTLLKQLDSDSAATN